jgi:hypothetical protein
MYLRFEMITLEVRAMDEGQELTAKIARYRRSLRAVFDPDVLRRLGQMIETAEKRLAEIGRASDARPR